MERGFVSKHFVAAQSEPIIMNKKKQANGNRHFYRLPVEKSELALIIQASLYPLFCNFSVVCIFLVY